MAKAIVLAKAYSCDFGVGIINTAAILTIKTVFLKARQWRAFKKTILVFPVPKALETPKITGL